MNPTESQPPPLTASRSLEQFDFARPRRVRQLERRLQRLRLLRPVSRLIRPGMILGGLCLTGILLLAAVGGQLSPGLALMLVEVLGCTLMLLTLPRRDATHRRHPAETRIESRIRDCEAEIERLRREHSELLESLPAPNPQPPGRIG